MRPLVGLFAGETGARQYRGVLNGAIHHGELSHSGENTVRAQVEAALTMIDDAVLDTTGAEVAHELVGARNGVLPGEAATAPAAGTDKGTGAAADSGEDEGVGARADVDAHADAVVAEAWAAARPPSNAPLDGMRGPPTEDVADADANAEG